MASDRREKLKRIVREYTVEKGQLPPTKEDLLEEFSVTNWESLRRHMNDLENDGEVITIEDGQRVRYAPPTYDPDELASDKDDLANTIRDTIKHLRSLIRRNPTIEEVGETCGRDPQDDTFRTVFYTVAKDLDWRKPTENQMEAAKQELQVVLRDAIERYHGIKQRHTLPEDEESDEVLEYIRNNQGLLDDVDISYTEGSTTIATLPRRIHKYAGTDSFRFED